MTILTNTYQTTGTSQAVTVPYQSKPFLGFIFIQAANGSALTAVGSPWAHPASSGAGGLAVVYALAFDDPVSPSDSNLSVTVNVTTGPLLVIAMSVSSDEAGINNVSYHDVETGTGWSGNSVPATGTVKETSPFWLASDIDVLGFVTTFFDHSQVGSQTVVPTSPLTEIVEVLGSTVPWAIEVCHEPNPPGTNRTVTVNGTFANPPGSQQVDGAVFTFHIDSTFVRSGEDWHVGAAKSGGGWA